MNELMEKLLKSVDTGMPLRRELSKLESKIVEVQSNLWELRNDLYKKEVETKELKEKASNIAKVLTDSGLNEDAVCQALSKQFKLPNKKPNKTVIVSDGMTSDVVDFVSRHPDGVGMKAIVERFGGVDKLKLAKVVKLLVDKQTLSKSGIKKGTLYSTT
jgi:SMC interacting uncharacterized protein involved in chromosome segregation